MFSIVPPDLSSARKMKVSSHWKAFGWDEKTGIPLPETIGRLKIDELLRQEEV
ncbi:MAG: hypothetical protein IJK14_03210 [Clostridia bacterium]|nr:hypothetical protein [Clostridia bacterium]